MVDLALFILLGIAVITLAVWGGIVAVKALPENENRRPHLWMFIGCGVVAFVLTVVTGLRNYYAQKEATQIQTGMQGDLSQTRKDLEEARQSLEQSRLAEEFMKGQLSGLSLMVGKIGDSGYANSQIITKAIATIAKGPVAAGVEAPAIQRMTSGQLKSKVIDFVGQLRQMSAEMTVQTRQLADDQMRSTQSASSGDKNKVWDDFSRRTANLYISHSEQIQSCCVVSATEYKDEMIRRIGPETPADLEKFPFTFWMGGKSVMGPTEMNLDSTAAYLEYLARKLPN